MSAGKLRCALLPSSWLAICLELPTLALVCVSFRGARVFRCSSGTFGRGITAIVSDSGHEVSDSRRRLRECCCRRVIVVSLNCEKRSEQNQELRIWKAGSEGMTSSRGQHFAKWRRENDMALAKEHGWTRIEVGGRVYAKRAGRCSGSSDPHSEPTPTNTQTAAVHVASCQGERTRIRKQVMSE